MSVAVPGKVQTTSPKFERWEPGDNGNLTKLTAGQGRLVDGDGVMTFPANSITVVRLAGVAG